MYKNMSMWYIFNTGYKFFSQQSTGKIERKYDRHENVQFSRNILLYDLVYLAYECE